MAGVQSLIGKMRSCKPHDTAGKKKEKLKIELPYDPAIPLLGIYLDKTNNSKIYMHPYAQSGTIHNGQDIKTT